MQEDLDIALEVLSNGGIILLPTDTVWALGCNATNSRAITRLYKIKFRLLRKPLTIMAENTDMIKKYVENVPDIAIELNETYKDPLTIVYDQAKNLPKILIPYDGSIAIRIPRKEFCLNLIRRLGHPLIATSANFSGDPPPLVFSKISSGIKDAVDYICTTDQTIFNSSKPSAIIKVKDDGQMQIIRS
jgi:L-threonylcarbamoyladenylate synthase